MLDEGLQTRGSCTVPLPTAHLQHLLLPAMLCDGKTPDSKNNGGNETCLSAILLPLLRPPPSSG